MFGVENRTTVPIEVDFNVGIAHNLAFSGQGHLARKIVEPNRVEFLMNVRREH